MACCKFSDVAHARQEFQPIEMVMGEISPGACRQGAREFDRDFDTNGA